MGRWVEVSINLGADHAVSFTLPEQAYRELHGVMLTAPGGSQVEATVRYVAPPEGKPEEWQAVAAHLGALSSRMPA